MNYLKPELATLDSVLPGLAERLRRIPFAEMERPGNPALNLYREAGGPGLLIPADFGGRGATARQAVHVHRALGFLAPSLSVAATMHNFSVAGLVQMALMGPAPASVLLGQIAGGNLFVASGVAEGRSGTSALSSGLQVRRGEGGLIVRGSKKPCCLSASMDLLTASLALPAGGPHAGELAFAVIPADSPGLDRRPFWNSPALAGAESDEVILNDVAVADEQLCFLDPEGALLAGGFLWFELLISASYLGIADGLVAPVLERRRGTTGDRARLALEHEAASAGLEAVAHGLDGAGPDTSLLARALAVRYAVQRTIEETSALAAECLGGLAFVTGPEFPLRHAAARMLAFHPPARAAGAAALEPYFQGGPLALQ